MPNPTQWFNYKTKDCGSVHVLVLSISVKSERHMIVALVRGGEEIGGLWVLMAAKQSQIQRETWNKETMIEQDTQWLPLDSVCAHRHIRTPHTENANNI